MGGMLEKCFPRKDRDPKRLLLSFDDFGLQRVKLQGSGQ